MSEPQQPEPNGGEDQSAHPPPPYGEAYPPPPPPLPMAKADDTGATTALILGILSLLCCGLLGPFAIFKGRAALKKAEESGNTIDGRGSAIAAIVLGAIGTASLILAVIYFVVVGFTFHSEVQNAKEQAPTQQEYQQQACKEVKKSLIEEGFSGKELRKALHQMDC